MRWGFAIPFDANPINQLVQSLVIVAVRCGNSTDLTKRCLIQKTNKGLTLENTTRGIRDRSTLAGRTPLPTARTGDGPHPGGGAAEAGREESGSDMARKIVRKKILPVSKKILPGNITSG